MRKKRLTDKRIENLVDKITHTYKGDSGINFIDVSNLPVRGEIAQILDLLFEVLFPGHTGKRSVTKSNIKFVIGDLLCQVHAELSEQIERAYRYQCRIKKCGDCDCRTMAEDASQHLLTQLPKIRGMLKGDVGAAFGGDPAAQSHEEIVISYPYISAIATYRIAHELYLKQVPLIPRIMSECSHSKTGIDIHPGAKIGKNFFIDHGTGVVVGETSTIGDNVRFYQGVSLIAVSIPKKAQNIKGAKRHPTIEDDVTIYAEATLLGNITIGKGSIIGGNVWIGKSVPPGTTVSMAKSQSLYEHRKHSKRRKVRKNKR
ncbi:MAG: serine O-acetyltransferase EpsC [Planctomycetota bacterium]|jgi:serine O-acetyltransferase